MMEEMVERARLDDEPKRNGSNYYSFSFVRIASIWILKTRSENAVEVRAYEMVKCRREKERKRKKESLLATCGFSHLRHMQEHKKNYALRTNTITEQIQIQLYSVSFFLMLHQRLQILLKEWRRILHLRMIIIGKKSNYRLHFSNFAEKWVDEIRLFW